MASLRFQLEQRPPREILVIRTDRVGDLLLSTPFLRGLRAGFPLARITALVDAYCGEVLRGTGLVDEIVDCLPEGPFDLAVALAPRSSSLKLARRSKAPLRLGYSYSGRPLVGVLAKLALTHRETITIRPPHQVPHEVEQLDRLARRLGLPSTLETNLQAGAPQQARQDGRLVFHLGDRWLVGEWSLDSLQLLLSELSRLGEVIVTTGPREKAWLEQQGEKLARLDIRNGLSFAQWASLISSAACLISPDTGAVHVAAAMGTPVVVAYEAATFEHCSRQWAPWRVASRSVIKGSPAKTIPALLAALEELVSNSRKCDS